MNENGEKNMKIETWYDIGCDICGRHRSTDFCYGWEEKRKGFSVKARKEGWKFKNGKNICPICVKEGKTPLSKIPEKYMFKGSYGKGGGRTVSPIGIELGKKMLEELECPCCGEKAFYQHFNEFMMGIGEYYITCENCDWTCPTGPLSDCGENIAELKEWLEAFELLGKPTEKVNEDLTLFFYPDDGWRESIRKWKEKQNG